MIEAARDRAARRRRSCARATACCRTAAVGFNRSGLMAGLILIELGMPGAEAVARLRAKRPGALFNEMFADYLASIWRTRDRPAEAGRYLTPPPARRSAAW